MRIAWLVLGTFLSINLFAATNADLHSPPPVYLLEAKSPINPVLSKYLGKGIQKARQERAQAVIILLDTPGGLMTAMREIIEAMLNAPIPIIIYVAPRGAQATSAGVFITMAGDVAAMAPGTNIGAAHPVSLAPTGSQGETKMDQTMEKKAVSDAAAYMESLAKDKNRNWQWAVSAVRDSRSLTGVQAYEQKVVEYLAEDLNELLKQLDGKKIKKNNKEFELDLNRAPQQFWPMNFMERFLNYLAHPNVAYILLMLGIYGLIYEFSSPGIGLGAALGGICLLLAFMALQLLPVNYAGLLLILLGIILLLLEIKIASHGVLTLGGVAALILGSFTLIDSPDRYYRISTSVIISTAAATVAFFTFALTAALKIQKKKPITGKEGLLGRQGHVVQELNPQGMVMVEGELWQAVCSQGMAGKEEKILVESIEGNHLVVKKINN